MPEARETSGVGGLGALLPHFATPARRTAADHGGTGHLLSVPPRRPRLLSHRFAGTAGSSSQTASRRARA